MVAQRLDGKQLAAELRQSLKTRVAAMPSPPGLAVVIVGEDPASHIYVRNKQRACDEVGIRTIAHHLPANTTEAELLTLINSLNTDSAVHGILVQLPLPAHIRSDAVIDQINPEKDVDGFHPYNLGRLAQRRPLLRPCTPRGIVTLLEHYKIPVKGARVTIVGASNIVGRPLGLELLLAGSTVTTCHRFSRDLAHHVKDAEILVSAVGKINIVDSSWIPEGAVVVDVGIVRTEEGKIRGDIDFETASERASWITPVPGGVGPMTIAALLENTVEVAEKSIKA